MFSKLALAVTCSFMALASAASCGPAGTTTRGQAAPGAEDGGGQATAAPPAAEYAKPVVLATLEDKSIRESSGLAASRRNPGLFWTHNDSGGKPLIYAFDREGRARGVWHVEGATARDWEDIAWGPGPLAGQSYLYIGDVGDNRGRRGAVIIYRVAEPEVGPADARATAKKPNRTAPAVAIHLKYPSGGRDAEALLVHPQTGDLYIVTKSVFGSARIYKAAAPLPASGTATLALLGELRLPSFFSGMVTGGDISPDGTRVVLCDYGSAYELRLDGRGGGGARFDEIWKRPLTVVPLGERRQGEAVCYSADGRAILATSEKLPTPLIEVKRKGAAD